jgi:pyruvate dehydrogenase E2 component (dihydrolipoamide acetyltransferase)
LGGIGGTSFTPIVNSPEVSILGVSRGSYEPVYDKVTKEFEPRLMLPLSLSYDHRIIDGADAARFLRWVCEALEQPIKIMVEG